MQDVVLKRMLRNRDPEIALFREDIWLVQSLMGSFSQLLSSVYSIRIVGTQN